MNCKYLLENLYEYLDGSLSAPGRAAAERHLADCPACRETVRRESQLARVISSRLEQTVEAVALDAVDQRRMASVVERKLADSQEQPLVLFWRRMAMPFAAAAVLLVVVVWAGRYFVSGKNLPWKAVRTSSPSDSQEIFVHVSYSVPSYTFRKEGNQVVDAITSEIVVAEQSLAVKNGKPRTGETFYEN